MLLIAVMGLVGNVRVCAQVDTEFWFAAPFASPNGVSNFHLPVYMRFSSYDDAATVTISQPANAAFAPITFTMPANSVNTIDLSPFINQIHNTPADQVLNRGLLITATADVSVYYEIASTFCGCSPELYSLKGRNALGTEFLLSYQTVYRNNQGYNPRPRSSFEIVASMDNTQVTITPTTNLDNHAAGVPYTVTLNRGETFAGKSVDFNSGSQPNGTVVTANNPIAITLTDDLVTPNFGGCADLMGDQTVPVAVVGEKYIVIKGGLSSGELISILATRNNTQIFLDGSGVPSATINRGQSFIHYLTAPSVYIETTEPAYVLHISGFGCELGEAILPPIECTGSNLINAVRTTPNAFAINVLATANIINAFTINGSPALIPPAAFSPVPGTGGQWVSAKLSFTTAQVPVGGVVSVANTDGFFHIGVIHDNNGASGGGCSYGYFSNFSQPVLYANDTSRFCFGDSVNLTTTSGWDSIWWINLATLDTISNDTSLNLTTSEEILLVTELSGCLYFDTITVHENDSMYFVPNVLPASCLGQDGVIDVDTVIGNWGSYTFLFNNNPAVPPFANLATGGYPITVIDSMACEASQTVTVTSGPNGLILQIDSAGQPACSFNDSTGYIAYAILNGVAPYDVYLNGNLLGNNAQALLDSLPNGNYTLLVEDANNCLATWDTVFNIAPATPIALLPDSALVCYGDTAALSIVPQSWDYVQWTDSASNTVVGTTTSYQATASGTLWVEAGLAQCIYRDTIRVTVLPQIYLTASFASVSCFGGNDGEVDLTNITGATGGIVDYFFDGNNTLPPFGNVSAGVYPVSVTDNAGCTGSIIVAVPQPDSIAINVAQAGFAACGYGTIDFNITGGTLPYVVTANSVLLGNVSAATLDSLAPGNYTITVTDANGCTMQLDTALQAPAFVNRDILTPSNISLCAGENALLDAGAGWDSIFWMENGTVFNTTSTWLVDSTINIMVRTTDGTCEYWDSISVFVADSIIINATIQPISCFGANDGALSVAVQGGNGAFAYSFNNNPIAPPYGNLGPASYNLVVIDGNGCEAEFTFALTEPAQLTILLDTVSVLNCAQTSGLIGYTTTGGTLPLTVTLDNASPLTQPQGTYTGVAIGAHTVQVTDSNGCTATIDTAIAQLDFAAGEVVWTNVSCFGAADGTADVVVTQGTPPYQYFINGTPTILPASNLAPGSYSLLVTDANGCSDTLTFDITEPPLFEIDLDSVITIFLGQEVTLEPTYTDEPVSFAWIPPYGLNCDNCPTPVASPDSSTLYNLTATNGNGCTAQASVLVDVLGHVIYIPNVFTPNNDLLNDEFRVYGQGFADFEFKIFDRWGELIFRTTDVYRGWDGTFKGVLMPPGTYVYTCNYRFFGGYEQLQIGSVLLLR